MKIKNLEYCLEPKTTLFKEEADVIVAVVLDAIKKNHIEGKTGTFALFGNKKEKDPEQIISFDLEDGSSVASRYLSNSNDYAKIALKKAGAYTTSGCKIESPLDAWGHSMEDVLELETTYGQFLAAFFSSERDFYVYYAIAKALTCMGKEDIVMVENANNMLLSEAKTDTGIYYLIEHVENLFENAMLPEIKAWKEWHDKEKENLKQFFED